MDPRSCNTGTARVVWLFVRSVLCVGLLFLPAARAEDLTIQFASPVAAQSYRMKRSAFVLRVVGCQTDTKPELRATVEGRVDGRRRSLPLKITPASTHNVFGIFREWPEHGVWVVSISAQCAAKTAGALVATDAKGLVRQSSVSLDHTATEAEIENALNRGKNSEGGTD
jgi:hypothetical protein